MCLQKGSNPQRAQKLHENRRAQPGTLGKRHKVRPICSLFFKKKSMGGFGAFYTRASNLNLSLTSLTMYDKPYYKVFGNQVGRF